MDAYRTINRLITLLQTAIDLDCKSLTIDIKFCKEVLTAIRSFL